jgi:hypothetical protein
MRLQQNKPPNSAWADIVLQGKTSTRPDTEQEVNAALQDNCSDGYGKDLHPSPTREECQKSSETAATRDTQIMKITAEDTIDEEQELDQSEGMTVDEFGPLDSTEGTREIRGEQAVTTTTSNALSTETDVAMEEARSTQQGKQHKDLKVRTGSPPLPPQMMKQLHYFQRLVQKEIRN